MQIDARYSDAQIRQFAGELGKLPHADVTEMERLFEGRASGEFYRGLLAGYANALVIARGMPDGRAASTLERLVAFIADRIERMEA